ncbi:FIST C-terminal domain-containing protein [bacterium]|nr:FIST C-terminal domain-containing protein [bacterium]MBU1884012.1 FIST C-terminal domain-containing protein [bacterium]
MMIRTGQSQAKEPKEAVREFHASISQPNIELVIFFCSNDYDLEQLTEEINHLFGKINVIGCTTAGEIGPMGYLSHSISGVSFSSESCLAVTGLLDNLNQFTVSRTHDFTQALLQQLEGKISDSSSRHSFALMLIDGLSVREEPVAHMLQHALGTIPLFGGSAGDGLNFAKTYVYHDGRFHSDSVVLAVVSTSLPFKIFKTQHFVSTDKRLVITQANPKERTVQEINGFPAAEEYARLTGISVKELDPAHFADSPVVVKIDGADYVRAIQKANPDGSLTFYCAIEEGVVLRIAHGLDIVKSLEETFQKIYEDIGEPQLVIGCDCILRNQEIIQSNQKAGIEKLFQSNKTIGFSSYGEQFHGVHVNQTLTGIAIGKSTEK